MITGGQLVDAVQRELAVVQDDGLETYLLERGIDGDALRALVRYHGADIVEGAEDVHGAIVQSVILGFLAGRAAHDAQVSA